MINGNRFLTSLKIFCNHKTGWFVFLLLATLHVIGQTRAHPLPRLFSASGRHALIVDEVPYFIFGVQAHNSSGWPAMLPQLWNAYEAMHANTLEVPVYWEQIEPLSGQFDFSLVDTLITQAINHHAHLVLLWFATWKNGSNHYMPEWMKRDAAKYPNVTGKNGKPVDSPSPNEEATLEADIKAFTAFTRHLVRADEQRMIIMIQIENEAGAWGSVRDYSSTAQKLFDSPVPAELMEPSTLKALQVPVVQSGNWKKVFGDRADEYFHAWSVARFIGQVAAAGKHEYPIPMYVNAALRDPLTNPMATNYESGGPTDNVIPIWKAAAPAINILAPDIYLSSSETILKVIELYDRPDNPLFVPELGWDTERVKYLYEVLARGGIGFSPFGVDDNGRDSAQTEISARLAPFANEYATTEPMAGNLAKWSFEGKIKAALEREDHADQIINLGNWKAVVSFGSGERKVSEKINKESNGKLLVVRLDENRFLLMGTLCRVSFIPSGKNAGREWQYLKVEEGSYENGLFKPRRILNGDETDWGGPRFGPKPTVLQAEVILR